MRIGFQQLLILALIVVIVFLFCLPQIKKSKKSNPSSHQKPESDIEKLSHLKELLDRGIITQEEFDAKKKDILSK